MGEVQTDEQVWFSDGNIIVVAANKVAFQVHKGILSLRSEVFRDLFSHAITDSDAAAADSETVEGCPVVHLTDPPEDIRQLFLVLCCGKNYVMPASVQPVIHAYGPLSAATTTITMSSSASRSPCSPRSSARPTGPHDACAAPSRDGAIRGLRDPRDVCGGEGRAAGQAAGQLDHIHVVVEGRARADADDGHVLVVALPVAEVLQALPGGTGRGGRDGDKGAVETPATLVWAPVGGGMLAEQ